MSTELHHDVHGDPSIKAEELDRHLGHVVPAVVYFRVLVALLLLTVLTVVISRTVHLGQLSTVTAISIASAKAFLVALWFMHLKFEKKTVVLFAIYPIIILVLLLGISVFDVWDRVEIEPSFHTSTQGPSTQGQ